MKTIRARNVDEALYLGVDFFRGPEGGNYRKQESRNGTTRESIGPVITHYTKPWERVSFQKERDANPFFHLYEAIWMLAGSKKLKKLTYFNAGMADFSDDGETLNGAYGYRWVKPFMTNQIDLLLSDDEYRQTLGEIGVRRMGPPGGSSILATLVLKLF